MTDIEKTDNLISTYMERSLHASLKKHFCSDESMHEIRIGRFIADACNGKTIFEVQTGNFAPLTKKLKFYIENTDFDILVVRPIAKNRRVFWIDADGALQKAPRLSSRHENIASGIADLYYIKEFLSDRRVSFCFPIMEIDEVRLLDGYGKQKKIRATSVDRIAGDIYEIKYINDVDDIKNEIFPLLPDEPFDRKELSRCLKLSALKLWSAQKLFCELKILSVNKEGRKFMFEKLNV